MSLPCIVVGLSVVCSLWNFIVVLAFRSNYNIQVVYYWMFSMKQKILCRLFLKKAPIETVLELESDVHVHYGL